MAGSVSYPCPPMLFSLQRNEILTSTKGHALSGTKRGKTRASPARRAVGAPWKLDQLQLERLQYGPGAVTHAQLGQDVGDVVLDGALGHAQ